MNAAIIYGGPGTGKTHRLRDLACSLEQEEKRSLILLYNGHLAKTFKISLGQTRHHVGTLPQFCYQIIIEHFKSLGYASVPRSISFQEAKALHEEAERCVATTMYSTEEGYQERVRSIYRESLRKHGVIGYHDLAREISDHIDAPSIQKHLSQFTHVIVDDGQDLFLEEWKLLRCLNIPITLAGDVNSTVAVSRGARPKELQQCINQAEVKTALHTSFRCKPWICTFTNQLIDHNHFRAGRSMVAATASQITSQLFFSKVQNPRHQINHVLRQALECLKVNPQITVGIGLRSIEQAQGYSEALTAARVGHQIIHLRNRLEEFASVPARVTIGTAQDLKGLTFTAMIIPDAVEGMWPKAKELDIEETRRQFYVLSTRATSVCYFMASVQDVEGNNTILSRFLKEGNFPDIMVHGLPA